MIEYEIKDECDGCCYKEWHNGDKTKCNFLNNNQCMINENKNKYMLNE